jgi:transposase
VENHQRAERHGVVPAENTAERAEQAKMLKRIRELDPENEILPRATAYSSPASLKVGQARLK